MRHFDPDQLLLAASLALLLAVIIAIRWLWRSMA